MRNLKPLRNHLKPGQGIVYRAGLPIRRGKLISIVPVLVGIPSAAVVKWDNGAETVVVDLADLRCDYGRLPGSLKSRKVKHD
jgi:hypothetical protein